MSSNAYASIYYSSWFGNSTVPVDGWEPMGGREPINGLEPIGEWVPVHGLEPIRGGYPLMVGNLFEAGSRWWGLHWDGSCWFKYCPEDIFP